MYSFPDEFYDDEAEGDVVEGSVVVRPGRGDDILNGFNLKRNTAGSNVDIEEIHV